MTDHSLNTTRNSPARVVLVAQTRTQITRVDVDTIRVEAVEEKAAELRNPTVDASDHQLTRIKIVAAQKTPDTKSIIDEVAEALTGETRVPDPVIIQPSNEMKLTNFTRRKSGRGRLRLKRLQLLNSKELMWCPSPEK